MKHRIFTLAAATVASALGIAVVANAAEPAPKAPAAPSSGKREPVVLTPTKAPPLSAEQSKFFEGKVRPLLAANCYSCHSAESGKAKGGLVLDTRDGWQKGGEHGPALVPGDPAKSLLVKAISYADPDLQMPPKGERLSEKDVATLTEWIRMGAPDPRTVAGSKLTGLTDTARAHWAYQPVKRPAVPQPRDKAWVASPVDAFVLARLEQNGMKPSPAASKEALIRRATFDLTGLPPTPEEVRAFEQDASPDAFAKVVDRLLASPHYGERWGRFWLDSARYSDTSGQENNNLKTDYRYAHAWTYRDYVINAFNDDKPYDQFLKEQIAADLLPTAKENPSTLAALGFLTVGKRFQNPNDKIDERIDALTKSTMALTVACTRCHDHKFDPIPTADYYSLHGIFASTVEPDEKPLIGEIPSGPEHEDYLKKLAEIERKDLDIYYNFVESKAAEFRRKPAAYLLTSLYNRKTDAAGIIKRNKLVADNRLDRDLYQYLRIVRKDHEVFAPLVRFFEVEADLPASAAGVLSEIASGRISRRTPVNPLVVRAFKDVKPESLKSIEDVADVYGRLFEETAAKTKAYIAASRAAANPVTGYEDALVELSNVPAPIEPGFSITTERLKVLAQRLPSQNNNAYQRFHFADINELELTHPGAPARAMVVADSWQPKNSPVFIRGEAQNRGPVVPRRFLEILSGPNRQPFKVGSGRLELADAIASRDNPLTARVMINRVWMHHFAEGFVRTPDDLGVQSEPPSHPELLDYLASEFVNGGWRLKPIHRVIMLSAAYRQSSDTNAAYATKDPDNRLIWRANLRRLDFEAVRDSMLQFTGKLDPSIGGRPVNLTDEPYSNRRSVYGYIDRGRVPELMQQFDFADPDMANSHRTTTIVPQQALFFMNSPMSVDVARKVTARPEFKAAKDDADRVRAIYQVLFQRAPRPEEVRLAADFIGDQGRQEAELAAATEKAAANLSPADQKRAQTREEMRRQAKLAQQAKMQANRKGNARAAIRNEGEIVQRKPLTVWERYAQALLFSNEIAYVN
jgi:cytochrome c553